jgi:23S rRNA pseudouridine2605 synthase
VTVNGRVVTELGARADPNEDHIKVGGKHIPRLRFHAYFALNKPDGVVTTMDDPERRPSVGELARALPGSVYPVGRLDFHSAGLLLLTNDGELCQRLTHPRYHVEKSYVVKVNRVPSQGAIERLRAGVRLADGVTAPAYVRRTRVADGKAWLELRISEGRNQQIRRMIEAVGLRVEKLRRTSIGPVKLGSLPTGQVRALTTAEVRALRRAVELEDSRSH